MVLEGIGGTLIIAWFTWMINRISRDLDALRRELSELRGILSVPGSQDSQKAKIPPGKVYDLREGR